MSRSSQSPAERQLIAQAHELVGLGHRAIALAQALQGLTGLPPAEARERLAKEGGAQALAQLQARVAAMLDRAEVATRQVVGPPPATLSVQRRTRARHHFI